MNEYISIRNQWCINASCELYEKMFEGNVVVHSRRQKRFRCTRCGKTWVSHRRHVRYGLRTDISQLTAAHSCLAAGMSVRAIAKKLNVSPSTVQRWKRRFTHFTNNFYV